MHHMIKKTILLILIAILLLSLVGCNDKQTNVIIVQDNNEVSNDAGKDDNPSQYIPKDEYLDEKLTNIYGTPYLIIEGAIPVYSGEHHITTIDKAGTGIKVLDDRKCMNYEDYATYCSKFGIEQKYSDKNQNHMYDFTHHCNTNAISPRWFFVVKHQLS